MTVEPAIYIPEEGFAVRLENDVLVTETGPVDLMAGVPIEADEIESLMSGQPVSPNHQQRHPVRSRSRREPALP